MERLDWTLLRTFLAVVESGSLSSAASRLKVAQPTLSRHVRELEGVLGVTLFVRTARGLEPTEAALGLISDARNMGEAAQALALKAFGRSQQLTGTVRVTSSVMVANMWLPSILAELRQAEPSIQIELVASDTNQNLLRRDADIAIRMADPTHGDLIARKLGDAPLGLYGARSYFDKRGRIATMRDLLEHDIIGFDRSEVILKVFAANGQPVQRNMFPIRCDDQMVYWNLTLAGLGVGFAQVMLADKVPTLERVPIDLMPPMPVWLVMHEEVRTSARIRRVADFLAAAITDLLQNRVKLQS
ncbi:DNA-binding transcriptional LysR family regulator [Rhizobium sp. BK650]|uniref:LysR family transcriptional regulator n=1 Tax=Rhizobium sp. BK650 TaxID=2586990 RepID=UPI00161BFFAF|nr:LysR family transcriptional regulator [Rhizobium sp. BK650]MBB3656698.1 DNA-binding transcriptional LysR family regulator [Rhizobium sp. BK650]